MNIIKLLPKETIDKIAAGEVVVNGASVLKELLENSIDALSKNIIVEIKNGGKTLIKVTDDGTGIYKDDIPNAILRNATSKIDKEIDAISTLGFRGEALASISYVSKMTLLTKTAEEEFGTQTMIESNEIISSEPVTANKGTVIEVRDLFFNIPARFKHLRKDSIETAEIIDVAQEIALSHTDISFKLICDGKEVIYTDGSGSAEKNIISLLGRNFYNRMIPIHIDDEPLFVDGYLSSVNMIEEKSSCRMVFLNGRAIRCDAVNQAVDSVYRELCGKTGADFILYIRLPYTMIDVNIHPAKLTVKLMNESLISMLIKQGIRDALKEQFVLKPNNKYSFTEPGKSIEAMVYEDANSYISPSQKMLLETEPQVYGYSSIENHTITNNSTEFDESSALKTADLSFQISSASETVFPTVKKEIFLQLSNMKFVGNAFGLYAMIECGDDLYAIDTHAAHERVLYEKYLQDFYAKSIGIQSLMIPVLIPMSVKAYFQTIDNKDLLYGLGFEIDDFGDNTIAIRSVPHYLSNHETSILFLKIMEQISVFGNSDDINKRSEKLIKAACHNAVRGSENISEQETKSLLKDLYHTQMPFTCPHGRPILGKLKMSFFMKAFERI